MKILRSKSKPKALAHVLFAHGAGAPMDSDWMNETTNSLTNQQLDVSRFEFPYMQERRITGKKRPPNRAPVLEQCWLEAIRKVNPAPPFFLVGKSMGGRIATHIANQTSATGVICLGFPFHGPSKPLGEKHLPLLYLQKPTLILQGERDPMGNRQSLSSLDFPDHIHLVWLPDGDHSFKPRKSSGYTMEENLDRVCLEIRNFAEALI